jgi:NitT/TauT family transport system ATP-binding protein
MVTHDVEEAVFLAQRVLVLGCNPGGSSRILPVDLPDERTLCSERGAGFLAQRAEIEDLVRGQLVR